MLLRRLAVAAARRRAAGQAAAAAATAQAAASTAAATPSMQGAKTQLLVDSWGAVSSLPHDQQLGGEPASAAAAGWRNVDGQRIEDGRYAAFLKDAGTVVPPSRIYTDPLHQLAYGSDASFYRLLPKAVIKAHSEDEVARLLRLAQRHHVPVTFRAAGTSLSGQAITDSVLIKIGYVGRHFRELDITTRDDGSVAVTCGVGLLGGEVNKQLAQWAKRNKLPVTHTIGPDPASIDAAMIGGIAANNASGMCCGVRHNTFHTLADMRIVLADGTVLDTADPSSCAAFLKSHAQLAASVSELAREVQADEQLTARIRAKYKLKNTVGYSLNALVDFPPDDPITIIKHLMVGSEGTLGFISRVTYNAVPQAPFTASAFVLFPDLASACAAVLPLKRSNAAVAVELCDFNSLRLAEAPLQQLVPQLSSMAEGAAALLIQVVGQSEQGLGEAIARAQEALASAGVSFGGRAETPLDVSSYPFSSVDKDVKTMWAFRKGLVPIVGGSRAVGTQFMIEDVVAPVEHLGAMTADLIALFKQHGYTDASAVGHALEGNLHFVFSQGFRTPSEVATFGALLRDMSHIVVDKYDGSLKGEHGTGRNMAPFVELEWGARALSCMTRIKAAFDPDYLLNPGVILNGDPNAHMRFLKPSPPAASLIDSCMECGYCEAFCPSRELTITPRQRIQTYREITRLRGLPQRTSEQQDRLRDMEASWQYEGDSTCAVDGMCAVRCPVNINTGEFTKQLRAAAVEGLDPAAGAASAATSAGWGKRLAMAGANHFRVINSSVPVLLNVVDAFHGLLGPRPLEVVSGALNRWSRNLVPQWNRFMPKGAPPLTPAQLQPQQPPGADALATPAATATGSGVPRAVVFWPTCVNRMMGGARGDTAYSGNTLEVFTRIAARAGMQVVVPQNLPSLCCGEMFGSRGATSAASLKAAEVATALSLASQMGKLPIVVDHSSCLATLKHEGLNQSELKFSLYEPVSFISLFLAPYLQFERTKRHVAVHVPCTSKQAGLEDRFLGLVRRCAEEVTLTGIPCCGMAGDRGMRFPELTAAACQQMQLPSDVSDGYSNSRTCEIGVSSASGVYFRSVLFLVDECTQPRPGALDGAGELPQQAVGQDGRRPSLTNVHERGGGAARGPA